MEPKDLPYTFFAGLDGLAPEIPADSIVSRTFYTDDKMKAILFGFAAGQELSEHTAAVPAVIHILEGEADLRLGEDHYEVRAGAWAHMPPRLSHALVAKTRVLMLLLMFKET